MAGICDTLLSLVRTCLHCTYALSNLAYYAHVAVDIDILLGAMTNYRIAGKFGGEFNLAAWRLAQALPNLIFNKFYICQNFVGCHLTIEQTQSEV